MFRAGARLAGQCAHWRTSLCLATGATAGSVWRRSSCEQPRYVDDKGYKHVLVRGVIYPPVVSEEAVREAQSRLVLRDSDIVIATYPKCGTTWMQQIVLTLLYGGDKGKVKSPMEQAPWLEYIISAHHYGRGDGMNGPAMSVDELATWDGATELAPTAGRRVFKTHAPEQLRPWVRQGNAKIIVVTRNPKDACVSLFHHTKDIPRKEYIGDFQHFVTMLFLQGRVESGCFWQWHAGWEKEAAHSSNIHVVAFEALKRDPVGTVKRIAQFLDLHASDDLITDTLAASTFSAMKALFTDIEQSQIQRGVGIKKNHIRKGEMGSWRSDITDDLLVWFDQEHCFKTLSSGLEYKFDFADGSA